MAAAPDFLDQDYLGREVHKQECQGFELCLDKHYDVTDIIGKGAYSIVFGGVDTRTGQKVAIKKIKQSIFDDEINTKRILREITILRQVKHEEVIEMLDIVPPRRRETFSEYYIVFGRMRTDLQRLIHSSTKLQPAHITYLGYQIFRALKYLHSVDVVHRDLTPSNILVSQQCQIKICDFGLSRKTKQNTPMTKHVVTRWYRAPEIMCWDEYNKPVDLWAAACILTELYLRKPLFPGEHFVHQLNLIFDFIGTPCEEDSKQITEDSILSFIQRLPKKKPVTWDKVLEDTDADDQVCDLISKVLIFNPQQRLQINEILGHPYFSHWHDSNDEPVGEKVISVDFEDTEDIEEIKDLLWNEAVKITRKKFTAQK